jgi:hypothetical protein
MTPPPGARSTRQVLDCEPFADLEEVKPRQACIPYAEAQRLLTIYREQGPDSLAPQQHEDIWDCLLAQMIEDSQAEIETDLAQRATARALRKAAAKPQAPPAGD